MAFDESIFWAAFKAVGFLTLVRVKQRGTSAVNVSVQFYEPDNTQLNGAQSKEYLIEYQHSDLPVLAEGDPVTRLDTGERFKVRSPPYVQDNPADSRSGFFRRAQLTKL
jgi:hypothetical protein